MIVIEITEEEVSKMTEKCKGIMETLFDKDIDYSPHIEEDFYINKLLVQATVNEKLKNEKGNEFTFIIPSLGVRVYAKYNKGTTPKGSGLLLSTEVIG